MSRLDGVCGGEVIVLTGVDYNAGKAVDDSGEILVDQGTLHVDVAEEDSIKGIVEHNVQSLEGSHNRDFRHAKS